MDNEGATTFSNAVGGLQSMVYVFSQSVAAMAEIEGMKAANADSAQRGEPMRFYQDDFQDVTRSHGLHHNTVVEAMRW